MFLCDQVQGISQFSSVGEARSQDANWQPRVFSEHLLVRVCQAPCTCERRSSFSHVEATQSAMRDVAVLEEDPLVFNMLCPCAVRTGTFPLVKQ